MSRMLSRMARRRWPGARPDRPAAVPGGRRPHGAVQHGDRRELERAGWRTTLDYRENLVRDRGGRLREVQVVWRAEAERESPGGGGPVVVWARGSTVDKVWSRLRSQADVVDVAAGAAAVDEDRHRPDPRALPAAPA